LKNLYFIFAYVTAIILSSCSTDATYTVEMIDGVRTVHNIKPVYEGDSKISLEFVRQIGELDGDDENLQFFNPRAIDFDSDGNMYILDAGNYRVQKLDKEGNFLLTFGRKGQGPGEFESPKALKILDDNTLLIADRGTGTLQSFSLSGELIDTIPFEVYYSAIQIFNDGNLLLDYEFYSRGTDEEYKYLAGIFDQKQTVLQKLGSWEKFDNRNRNYLGNSVGFVVTDNNIKFISYFHRNKIVRLDIDGKIDLQISKSRSFEESEKPESRLVPYNGNTRLLMEAITMHSSSILDRKNRLWILSTNKPFIIRPEGNDLEGVFNMDIYDQDGILLQSIPWDLGYKRRPIYVKNDLMYFIDTNEMSIMEYKIVEH